MKNFYTVLIIVLCTFNVLKAQQHEVGGSVGLTLFHGDLIENTVDFKEINLGGELFYRFYSSHKFSFKLALNTGSYSGTDANSSELVHRGLSFNSTISGIYFSGEWNILGINIYGEKAYNQNRISPFLSIGVGASMANPEVTTEATGLDPYDLAQEYPFVSLNVPFGIGVKYATDKITFSLEGRVVAGLTDLLDGVSETGNPDKNDWHSYIGIGAAYRIGGSRSSSSVGE